MECNKEKAIRAKANAETKMQNKDFWGARKVALKAQQLYPELENISHLLTVCDVHLSAENKGPGNGKNYYDILKIDSMADEISIKKQYKKFAFLLHPDKNTFAGATDAFTLVGEAQRVLLDHGTRSLHDAKLNSWKAYRAQPQQPASNNPNIRPESWAQNPFTGKTTSPFTSFNPQQQQPQKPLQSTFWTMCPYCMVKYQYYRDMIGKTLACRRCKRTFTGRETKDHAPFNQTTWDIKSNYGKKVGPLENASFQPQAKVSVAKTGTSEVRKDSKREYKPTAKVNCKKKRRTDESSKSSDSNSSSESDEDVIEENGDVKVTRDFGVAGENLRRSTRSKTNLSYKENLSDDDLGSSSKKSKSGGSFGANAYQGLEKGAHKTNKFEGSSKPMEEDDVDNLKPKEAQKGTNGPNVSAPRVVPASPTASLYHELVSKLAKRNKPGIDAGAQTGMSTPTLVVSPSGIHLEDDVAGGAMLPPDATSSQVRPEEEEEEDDEGGESREEEGDKEDDTEATEPEAALPSLGQQEHPLKEVVDILGPHVLGDLKSFNEMSTSERMLNLESVGFEFFMKFAIQLPRLVARCDRLTEELRECRDSHGLLVSKLEKKVSELTRRLSDQETQLHRANARMEKLSEEGAILRSSRDDAEKEVEKWFHAYFAQQSHTARDIAVKVAKHEADMLGLFRESALLANKISDAYNQGKAVNSFVLPYVGIAEPPAEKNTISGSWTPELPKGVQLSERLAMMWEGFRTKGQVSRAFTGEAEVCLTVGTPSSSGGDERQPEHVGEVSDVRPMDESVTVTDKDALTDVNELACD